ncbi:lactosylceramide 1,3-N-acetyl-beta-D-glucosaminyltransferase-like [Dreissena polymorpha]|nr:lactosylceramide 1,3-N-acetyl-beta-D-glucosaminyltransferase-like [Dreissena polymorpha]
MTRLKICSMPSHTKTQWAKLKRRWTFSGPDLLGYLLKMCRHSLGKIATAAVVTSILSLVFILNYRENIQRGIAQRKNLDIKQVLNGPYVVARSLIQNVTTTMVAQYTSTTLSPELMAITPQPELNKLINASSKAKYPVTINGKYVFENPQLCSSVANLSVLIIVHTAPDHFEMRLAIRRTWGNDTYYRKMGVARVLFLLGQVGDSALQMKMEAEFKEYRDMLQGDFRDSYRNLTHKGVMGFKWITERCRNAKFILKTDDDIVINMFILFNRVLPKIENKTKQIVCNHIPANAMPIIRDKNNKWYVSDNHFRGKNVYPEYCSGFMVLFTNDVIPAIFRAATMTPFFWVDDVYLYGLAPGHVPGIKYSSLTERILIWQNALSCYRNMTDNLSNKCDYLVTGSKGLRVSEETWVEMTKQFQHRIGTDLSLQAKTHPDKRA